MSDLDNIAPTRPARRKRNRRRNVAPLKWWRSVRFRDLGPEDTAKLSRLLAQVSQDLPEEWSTVVNGSVVDAMRAARDFGFSESTAPLIPDLIGSALLRHAMAGSADAAQTLAYMRYFHNEVLTRTAG
jgi:hypothetical protein